MFKTILLVEQKNKIRDAVKNILEQKGYSVLSTTLDEINTSTLRKSKTVLILTDIEEERDSGFRLLRMNRENQFPVPAVVLCRKYFDESVLRSIELGVFDCLIEPISEADLLQTIKRAEYFSRGQRLRREFPEKVKSFSISVEFTSAEFMLDDIQKVFQDAVLGYSRMNPDDFLTVWLAVEEALLNAHEHGNLGLHSGWKDELLEGPAFSRFEKEREERLQDKQYAERKVKMHLTLRRGYVAITIQDEGNGFQFGASEEGGLEDVYGRGLTIIDSIMDEMFFNEKGNEITMRKSFKPMR